MGMALEQLLEKMKLSNIATLEDFFEGASDAQCFAANACVADFLAKDFYALFKSFIEKESVQDVVHSANAGSD
jgi:hypothetical protein